MREFGSGKWAQDLQQYLGRVKTLTQVCARERQMQLIPVRWNNTDICLSPGGQNVLVKKIIEEFCSCFTPGGKMIYVGDTHEKWAYFDKDALTALGVSVDEHGKMPDIIVYDEERGWLVLIEAVTSHGPVNPKRHKELKELFAGSSAGLVFVTAFLDRKTMVRYLSEISWETEVWIAESPTHLIHFNGKRFLGPH